MALLAEIGEKNGYNIHIGKIEQSHQIDTHLVKKQALNDYQDYPNLLYLKNAQNIDIVGDIDVLWIKNDTVKYIFEVESTTSMTSALQRGSTIDKDVPKIMLFPSDRVKQFERKMKTPLFNERYESDNWKFVLFEELYKAWNKLKANLIIEEIANIEIKQAAKKETDNNQLEFEL
jgi:hypothetical protein